MRAYLTIVLVLFLLLLRKKMSKTSMIEEVFFDIQIKVHDHSNKGWTRSRDYVGTLLTCSLIQGLVSWPSFLFSSFKNVLLFVDFTPCIQIPLISLPPCICPLPLQCPYHPKKSYTSGPLADYMHSCGTCPQ